MPSLGWVVVWGLRPCFGLCARRCPTLPHPGGCSTIGAGGLSFRVRNGAGRGSPAMTTETSCRAVHDPPPCGGGVGVGVGPGPYSGRAALFSLPHRPRTVWLGVVLLFVLAN